MSNKPNETETLYSSPASELKALTTRALELIGDSKSGLPCEIFYFVSQLTPLLNVDLLIKNKAGQTLLTWRADEFYGPGWHVPGGIVRFKEHLATRIQAVAHHEIGCSVRFIEQPISIKEVMAAHRDVRGHFLSLLFACELEGEPDKNLKFSNEMPLNGQWQWHSICPDNLIRNHEMYRTYIDQNESYV